MIINAFINWLNPAKGAPCRCIGKCGCLGIPEKWLFAVASSMERVK